MACACLCDNVWLVHVHVTSPLEVLVVAAGAALFLRLTLSPALSLLTISVASASLSTSSAMINKGLWAWTTFSRMGRRDWSLGMGGAEGLEPGEGGCGEPRR